jgi:hypothetical protein
MAAVYLALEPEAARESIQLARQTGCSVWVGSDALTTEEYRALAAENINLTRFNYTLSNATPAVIEDALSTVREHHPHAIIWVQSLVHIIQSTFSAAARSTEADREDGH